MYVYLSTSPIHLCARCDQPLHYCSRQGLCSDLMIDPNLQMMVEPAVERAVERALEKIKEKEDAK